VRIHTSIAGTVDSRSRRRLSEAAERFGIPPNQISLRSAPSAPSGPVSPADWFAFSKGCSSTSNIVSSKIFCSELEISENQLHNILIGKHLLVATWGPDGPIPLATNRSKQRQLNVSKSWGSLLEQNPVELISDILWVRSRSYDQPPPDANSTPIEYFAYYCSRMSNASVTKNSDRPAQSPKATILLTAKSDLYTRKAGPAQQSFRRAYLALAFSLAREIEGLESERWLYNRLQNKCHILDRAFAGYNSSDSEYILYGAGTHTKTLLQILQDHNFPRPTAIVTTSQQNQNSMFGIPLYAISEFRPSKPRLIILVSSISYESPMRKKAAAVHPDSEIVSFWKHGKASTNGENKRIR